MIDFFKKYWLFIILAAFAFVLAALWYLKPQKQQQEQTKFKDLPKIEALELPGQSLNQNTSLSLNLKIPQNQLPVLIINRQQPFTIVQMTNIANTLGFAQKPTITNDINSGSVYIWNSQEKSLAITPNSNLIEFNVNLMDVPLTINGSLPDYQTIKERLNILLDEMGISSTQNLEPQPQKFLKVNGLIINETSQQDATIVEQNFTLFFEGSSIITGAGLWPIQIRFDRQGNIIKFLYQNPINSLQKNQDYPLKTSQELNQAIYTEGKILSFQRDQSSEDLSETAISSITISEVVISYFLQEKSNTLQPIFVLKGIGRDAVGQQGSVLVYLPAIKSQYFLQSTPQPF